MTKLQKLYSSRDLKESKKIMTQQNKIQLFEERKVRTLWDDEQNKWYFFM